MGKPDGSLTGPQFEILQLLWDCKSELADSARNRESGPAIGKQAESNPQTHAPTNAHGLTVAQIWEAVCKQRSVSRTTVLNLVDRLEKRGWLKRAKVEGAFRYQAAMSRKLTEEKLAREFVGEFFDGSPSSFMLSLLGSGKLSKREVEQLKSLIEDKTNPESPKNRKG